MKIYFLTCPPGPPEHNAYEHQILALAEGLSELGVQHAGNNNYWQYSDSPEHHAICGATNHDLEEYDVVVFSSLFFDMGLAHLLPSQLFARRRYFKTVLVDSSDGLCTPGFMHQMRSSDIVLKSHYNAYHRYPSSFVPWQFGLSTRIIESTQPKHPSQRNQRILSGFRVKHPVRYLTEQILANYAYHYYPRLDVVDQFLPDSMSSGDRLYWHQTGRRHYPGYYQRLGSTLICNASGGGVNRILKSPIRNERSLRSRIIRKLELRFNTIPVKSIHQFDSWRFWESLVSGCCTIHCDLEKYGCVFPVNPVNGKHYIGLDLDNPASAAQSLCNEQTINDISLSCRSWVLAHYSPKAVAERFLALVS